MNKKINLLQIFSFIVIAGLLVVIFIMRGNQISQQATLPVPNTGLQSTSTLALPSSQENMLITLTKNIKLELTPGTKMEVVSESTNATGSEEIVINLLEGSILALQDSANLSLVEIQTNKGYHASSQGCAMAVTYSQTDDSFKLDCISGQCELGSNPSEHLKADPGMTWSFLGGVFMNPQAVDEVALTGKFSSTLPNCPVASTATAPVPVTGGNETPTPTLDFGATATAACDTFHKDFPATPCP